MIPRGLSFKDVVELEMPQGYELESLPEGVKLEETYGFFSFNVVETERDGRKVLVAEREYIMNDGVWPAEEYPQFRDFMNLIDVYSNGKAVIIKDNLSN